MKKVLKKGVVLLSVYLIAVVCTLLISTRVEELDSNNLRNTNKSLSVNLVK